MLKSLGIVLCLCLLFYILIFSLKKEQTAVELRAGKLYSEGYINYAKNKDNFKEFSHTFWLYVEKPEDGDILTCVLRCLMQDLKNFILRIHYI